MTASPWQDEYWWLREAASREADQRHRVGEEFGIPDPLKVQAQVDAICAARFKE